MFSFTFVYNLKFYENKCLHLWIKLHPIDISIKISIYVNYYIRVHCFPPVSQNMSSNTYIVDTKLQNMMNIKNYFLTQLNIGSPFSNYLSTVNLY